MLDKLTKPSSFSTLYLNCFMNFIMSLDSNYFKVFNSVVKLIPINVMHLFTRFKYMATQIKNKSMLGNSSLKVSKAMLWKVYLAISIRRDSFISYCSTTTKKLFPFYANARSFGRISTPIITVNIIIYRKKIITTFRTFLKMIFLENKSFSSFFKLPPVTILSLKETFCYCSSEFHINKTVSHKL